MKQAYQSILIVKPSSLGDIIHALPFLTGLRKEFPHAHVAWLVHEKWADILREHPDLDEVIPWSFRWRGLARLIRIFRKKRFDCAIDLQGLLRSGVISYLSGAPVRIGFRNAREGSPLFYTHKVGVPSAPMHAVDRYLLVAEFLGIRPARPTFKIAISQQDEQDVEKLLSAKGLSAAVPMIVLNAGARWWTKRWPLERFAQLALRIRSMGWSVVLVGGRADQPDARRIEALTGGSVVSLVGKTSLKQLAAVLKRAALMISNDSGPLHLAVAMGTPVIGLYGATDPVRTGPYGWGLNGTHAGPQVIRKDLDCSPCMSRVCRVGDHRCMEGIGVDDIFDFVKKYVNL